MSTESHPSASGIPESTADAAPPLPRTEPAGAEPIAPYPTDALAKRNRLLLRIFYFTSFAAMGAYLPFFPAWLKAHGLVGLRMSLITAMLPAMTIVSPPVFGMVADILGLRASLLRIAAVLGWCSIAAMVASVLIAGTVTFAPVFAGMACFCFCRAAMTSISDVLALEASGGQRSGYGRLRLFGSLGFAMAALGFGRLFDPKWLVSVPLCIAVGMVPTMLAAFALPLAPRTTASGGAGSTKHEADGASEAPGRTFRQELHTLLASRAMRLFLVATFFGFSGHICYDLCWSLHFQTLGATNTDIGVSWALGTAAEIALMAWAAPLFARWSSTQLLAIAWAGASMRWMLIGTVQSVAVLMSLQFLHAVSFGLMWIASLSFLEEHCPKSVRVTAQGIFSATYGTGQVLGMLVWGVVLERLGGAAAFRGAACLAALACVFVVSLLVPRTRSSTALAQAAASAVRQP